LLKYNFNQYGFLKEKYSFFINAQTFLIIFIPPTFVFGPAIGDILLTFSSLIFLYIIIKEKLYAYLNNLFFKFFLFFCIYFIFSSLISDNPIFSLESSLFYIRFVFFSLTVFFLLNHSNKFINYIFYSLMIVFLLLIIDSSFQYFYGTNILGYDYDGRRVSSLFGDEKILGSYISRLTPLILGLIFLKFNNIKFLTFFLIIFFLLTDFIVLISAERAAIFFKILTYIFLFIFLKRMFYLKVFYLLAFLIMILTVFSIDNNIKTRVLDFTYEDFFNKKIEKNNEILIFTLQHQVIYKTSWKMFKDNPIFGIGPKMYRIKCSDKKYYTEERLNDENFHYVHGCSTHPHNSYLQLLSETGLVGFSYLLIIVLFMLYYLIYIIINRVNYKVDEYNFRICIIMCILITLWPIIPTGNFFNNWLSILYFFPVGFLFSILNKDENLNNEL